MRSIPRMSDNDIDEYLKNAKKNMQSCNGFQSTAASNLVIVELLTRLLEKESPGCTCSTKVPETANQGCWDCETCRVPFCSIRGTYKKGIASPSLPPLESIYAPKIIEALDLAEKIIRDNYPDDPIGRQNDALHYGHLSAELRGFVSSLKRSK